MERKKLLWISHLIPFPPKGGVLQRSFNLIKELSKYYDIYLFAFNQASFLKSSFPGSASPIEEAKRGLAPYVKELEIAAIPSEAGKFGKYRLAFSTLLSRKPYTVEWLRSDHAAKRLSAMIDSVRPDIAHYDTISLAIYQDLTEHLPTVLNHHNIESQMLFDRAKKETNLLKKVYFLQEARKLQRYEKEVCKEFSLNITCSPEDSLLLKSIDPSLECKDVPNGVDITYFYPAPARYEPHSLIFAGGLGWYPNLDAMNFFADEIWPGLKAGIPDIKMNLVGRSPTHKFRQLSENDPSFRVHGFVDDVRPYLREAHAYVCPIRDGGGTKLKILDALAIGCPVIAHPFACVGIDVEDGEHVLFATTPSEYVSQVKALFESDQLRQKLCANGPKLIEEKYSFSAIGADYAKQLKDLLQQSNKPVHAAGTPTAANSQS